MKLLVIILNYNVTGLTIDCLHSLAPEITKVPGTKAVVCENGTGGDAEDLLRRVVAENQWGSWAEVVALPVNLGFTGGNNVVIRATLGWPDVPEYFLLLNADTLAKPNSLKALVEFMDEHPEIGIGGSRLEWPDGTPQSSPFRFQGFATELDRGLRLGFVSKMLSPWSVCLPVPERPTAVDWVSGASMIIRREVVDDIGPLDEGLYTYFDDIDYCLNAKKVGWQTWFVPQSRIVHLEGSSTGIRAGAAKRRPSYWFEARRRFFLKNYGAFYTALVDAAFILGFAIWRVRRRLQGKPEADPPHMLRDAWRHSVFITGFKLRNVKNPAL